MENVVKKATDDLKKVTEAEAKASEQVTIIIIFNIINFSSSSHSAAECFQPFLSQLEF